MKKMAILEFPKIQKFEIFKSTIGCRTIPGHLVCQFSGLFFQTAILRISVHCKEKLTFLESWDKIGSGMHTSY